MKNLPIGIQTFSHLIDEHFVYVDKTSIIYELIKKKSVYFFARPRRFGKSLLISTMQAIFEGRRELFKDLAINKLDYDWTIRPVIRLDFSGVNRSTPEAFLISLRKYLLDEAEKFKINLVDSTGEPSDIFRTLVQKISALHGQVVLLVDEYDKPILDHLQKPDIAEEMRVKLRNFYDVFKHLDEHLYFIFITGVSRFTQTSIFSGLNNLFDLSTHTKTATLCGYTKDELIRDFKEHIAHMAEVRNSTIDQIIREFEMWYNGYCFKGGMQKVFNPFSVLCALEQQSYENFWIKTGTPNFLATMFRDENPLPQIDKDLRIKSDDLVIVNLNQLPFVPVLVQTGYLTFVDEDQDGYLLDFPNQEVSRSYALWSLAGTFNKESIGIRSLGMTLRAALKDQDFDSFFKQLIPLFATIPLDIQVENREKYYQSIIYLICMLVGADMDVELSTNIGIIDAIIKTEDAIIIFEFKLRGSAQEALRQIHETKYYERFLSDGRKIVLVGVKFDIKKRNITKWLIDKTIS